MDRQEVLMQIDSIVEGNCQGCTRLKGVPAAQRSTYCAKECVFGAKMNELGNILQGLSNKRKQRHIQPLLSKGDEMKFEDMQALLETDISRADLVEATGLTRNEIGDFLIANGYQSLEAEEDLVPADTKRRGRRTLNIPVDQFIELRAAGFTYTKIGEKLGYSAKQVSYWARNHQRLIQNGLKAHKEKIG